MSRANNTIPGSVASSVSFSGFRIVATTAYPREANNFAAALPSPEELPVMKMVLRDPLVMTSSSIHRWVTERLFAGQSCRYGRGESSPVRGA